MGEWSSGSFMVELEGEINHSGFGRGRREEGVAEIHKEQDVAGRSWKGGKGMVVKIDLGRLSWRSISALRHRTIYTWHF